MIFQLYIQEKTEMSAVNPEQKLVDIDKISDSEVDLVSKKVTKKFSKAEKDALLADSDSDIECNAVVKDSKKKAKIPACCVCTELPYDPQSLSCGHSLCIVCYETMLLKTPKTIKCPLCTKTTDVSAVIPNFGLREILQLGWETEYKMREILDCEEREKRKLLIKINKFVAERGIHVSVGRDRNPRLLLKIILCLEKNPDNTKYPVGLDLLVKDRKVLYIDNFSPKFPAMFSRDLYYCILSSLKNYILCVF